MAETRGGATTAFIAVGSNLSPEDNIAAALQRLCGLVQVQAVSTFYRTPPLPRPDGAPRSVGPGPSFINGVIRVSTNMPPRKLKYGVLRRIEEDLGRVRSADKFAPRTIDLDIILFGEQLLDERGLRLPEPDIRRRNFIAVPLLELAPELVLPDTGEALANLSVAQDRQGMEPLPGFTRRLRGLLRVARRRQHTT
jgi:dihydroneopterin aldolase/2-amino-4-hydroxy-6-hydroxymethyldihydropteridine diphosphokinase